MIRETFRALPRLLILTVILALAFVLPVYICALLDRCAAVYMGPLV